MSTDPKKSVIVVGAGWAGLAASLNLARKGCSVTLLEAAPQAGGRARAVSFGPDSVDNGQHLFLGAYHQTRTLLNWLKIPEETVFLRRPLEFYMQDLQDLQKPLHLKFSKLPAPWQGLLGWLQCSGLSLTDRLRVLKAGHFFTHSRLTFTKAFIKDKDSEDISVLAWLKKLSQPERIIQYFWRPLVLAALSTPIERASAEIFQQVLRETFSNASHSDCLFPKTNLSELLPNPILAFLQSRSHSIFFHERVENLLIENGACHGVKTSKNTYFGSVILATPPKVTTQLLNKHPSAQTRCHSLIENLAKFTHEPITTVYLRYLTPIQLKKSMIGLINGVSQWVFDRTPAGQSDLLSVIITGEIPKTLASSEALIAAITAELKQVFPKQKAPINARVICEKSAAFSCEVGISRYRPGNTTPLTNLYLAGDYTDTKCPASVEGALRSGIEASNLV